MNQVDFKEGVDFYFDQSGLMVLTENYHLKRGYCCGNSCRHCPYDHENVPCTKRELLKEKREQPASGSEEEKEK